VEMASWVTRFSTNDGLFASLLYLCSLADAKAKAYASSPDSTDKLGEWMLEEAKLMPFMAPSAVGIRGRQLMDLWRHAWTEDGRPPSDAVLRRQMERMVISGELVLVERNKRTGDLYRLPDPDTLGGESDERPVEEPAADAEDLPEF